MKHLIVLITAILFAKAGLFSAVSGMGMKEMKPDAEYTIDTAGLNPRIYEFTTRTKPRLKCVVIFGNANISVPAMWCTRKEKHEKNP